VILIILAQESPDSELRLKRYGEKNFRGKIVTLEWFRGLICEYRMFGELLCTKIGVRMSYPSSKK
jgi:hypothetical protein